MKYFYLYITFIGINPFYSYSRFSFVRYFRQLKNRKKHILPQIIYITNKTIDIPPMGNKPRKIIGYYFIVAFSIIMQRILMALFLKRTVYHYNISSEHNYLNVCSCVSFFYLYLCINIIDYSYASQMCIMPINEICFRYIDNKAINSMKLHNYMIIHYFQKISL